VAQAERQRFLHVKRNPLTDRLALNDLMFVTRATERLTQPQKSLENQVPHRDNFSGSLKDRHA
jgi:hypothetical protein